MCNTYVNRKPPSGLWEQQSRPRSQLKVKYVAVSYRMDLLLRLFSQIISSVALQTAIVHFALRFLNWEKLTDTNGNPQKVQIQFEIEQDRYVVWAYTSIPGLSANGLV